jgi:Flp pilus assembly protein TadG
MKAMNTINKEQSGQALVELSFVLVILCVFVFGIIDFGRAIYDVQVMKNLVGEGSSMASRGGGTTETIGNTVQVVVNDAGSDLKLSTNGCVIITTVTLVSNHPTVTAQASQCAITASSKVGCLQGQNGCGTSSATLPPAALLALQNEPAQSTIAATEIYYNYSTITPASKLLGSGVIPSQFYASAYY